MGWMSFLSSISLFQGPTLLLSLIIYACHYEMLNEEVIQHDQPGFTVEYTIIHSQQVAQVARIDVL